MSNFLFCCLTSYLPFKIARKAHSNIRYRPKDQPLESFHAAPSIPLVDTLRGAIPYQSRRRRTLQ
jgi:hypothetical protein